MSAISIFIKSITPGFVYSYKFNDKGGAGGGDRNSFYLPTMMP